MLINRSLVREQPNSFTCLRLLLASLVIVSHAAELKENSRIHELFHALGSQLSGGEFAVEAFFVVSGYLILQSWCTQPRLGVFLSKRVLRIFPAFIAASLISTFLVGWLGGRPGYLSELLRPSGVTDIVARLVLLASPSTPPVFDGSAFPMVNGALWTITYEFRCYLLIPLLAGLGLYSRRLLFALAWVGIVLAFGCYSVAHLRDAMSLGLLRFVPFFLAGSCAYLYRDRLVWNRSMGAASLVIAAVSLGSMAASRFVLPIAGSYAVLWLALSASSPLRYFSPSSDISYGVYLYGWPVQKLLLWYAPSLPLGFQMLLALAVSMVLGWASWHMIEKRFLAWKTRFPKWSWRFPASMPAAAPSSQAE